MTNPMTAEQYLIARIETLETEVDAFKADSEAWKTNYYAVRQELTALIDTIQSIGQHKYNIYFSSNEVDLDRVSQKYEPQAYATLSKYFSPVKETVNESHDEASEAEACEA